MGGCKGHREKSTSPLSTMPSPFLDKIRSVQHRRGFFFTYSLFSLRLLGGLIIQLTFQLRWLEGVRKVMTLLKNARST